MMFLIAECLEVSPNRFRRTFDEEKLLALCQSILDVGLLHPIVIRKDGEKYYVVAGERRLRAVRKLAAEGKSITFMGQPVDLGLIPVATYQELVEEDKIKEIELQENAIRADLTWQEHAQAVANLHQLRTMKNPQHSMADTTEEITGRRTGGTAAVRDEILLANNLHIPEVAKARTRADAIKTARAVLIREFEAALGTNYEENPAGDFVVEHLSAEVALACTDRLYDVILTDPPYGIDADQFSMQVQAVSERAPGGQHIATHNYQDDWAYAERLYGVIALRGMQITKPQAHCYVFCDIQHFMEVRHIFEFFEWDVWPRPLIWTKDVGSIPRPYHGPRRQYEAILYAIKGEKMTTALYSDVIECPAVKDKKHAAQKPVELYVNLLKRSCISGDSVIDPFCGSGTIFAAAKLLQLKAYGSDSDAASVGMARELIAKL